MNKKEKLSVCILCIYLFFVIISFVLIFVPNQLLRTISIIYLIVSLSIGIFIFQYITNKIISNYRIISQNTEKYLENNEYTLCEQYLKQIIENSSIPHIGTFANCLLVKTYLFQGKNNLAFDIIRKKKRVRESKFLIQHRIIMELSFGYIKIAKRVYFKWKSKLTNPNFNETLNVCARAINMCESKVFDETLYKNATTPLLKELCMKYKSK